jgi:Tfp pilus assembly protein PilF
MRKKSTLQLGLCLAALSTASGCASPSLSGMFSSMSPTKWFASKPSTPAERLNAQTPSKLVAPPSQLGATSRLGAPPPTNNSWMSSLPSPFGKKETNPMPLGDDPLSLSNTPKQMNPMLFVHLARMHEAKGDYENALKQYEQGLKLDPKNLDVLLGMARTYDRKDDVTRAVATYEQAIQCHPQSAIAHNDLALCHARHRDLEKARQRFEQAIALEPQSKLYRNNLATTLVQMGQHEAALGHLKNVLPEAAACYNVGFLANQMGQKEAAAHYFQQALTLDPQLAPARQLLDKMQGNANQLAVQAQNSVQQAQTNLNQVLQIKQTQIQNALPQISGAPSQSAPIGQRYAESVSAPKNDYSSEYGSPQSTPALEPPSDVAKSRDSKPTPLPPIE